jgi:protein-L-isoaspartate(D-aspartate) O-methyltransferase
LNNKLKLENENLRKELEAKNKKIVELEDENESQEKQIQLLQMELDEVTKELQEHMGEAKKIRYEPVSNPLQTALVNYLMDAGIIKTSEIEEIMKSIDRADFASTDPYVDRPQPIGFNTTISAPHMHAVQLELLKDCFKNAKKALDIGTGSGFVALCLSKMMKGNEHKTYALDHIQGIVELAKANIAKNHEDYIKDGRIEFVTGDGRKGLIECAPFDVIFVGGAVTVIPDELIHQLAIGGSMLIPVGEYAQQLTIVHKTKDDEIVKKPVMSVMFGRLQDAKEQWGDA